MRGWVRVIVVGGVAIAIFALVHTPAEAQTRAELVEWLFRISGSRVSYHSPDGAPYSPRSADYARVIEQECVITIQAKGRAGDKDFRDATITIDFNKMIASTLTIGGAGASVAGQPGFVAVKTFRRDTGAPLDFSSEYWSIIVQESFATGLKFPGVLRHFIARHCPGTNSVL